MGGGNQRHSLTNSGDGTVGTHPKERVSILDLGEQEFLGGGKEERCRWLTWDLKGKSQLVGVRDE